MMSPPPALPSATNPHLSVIDLPPVKYQILTCQGQDILVGRLKIDTPTESGHAFILRRYDTGAISATTMFRAAFPTANDQDERIELQWVKENHDLAGNNGSSRDTHIARLAGTWIDVGLGLTLSTRYGLRTIIENVVAATPNPTANYRRSAKSGGQASTTPKADPDSTLRPISNNKTAASPSKAPPAKRVKQQQPSSPSPRSPSPAAKASPAPRRSTRMKSPSIRAAAVDPMKNIKTPKKSISRREVVVDTPGGSEQTVVDEDADGLEKVITSDLHSQDIEEQKDLIQGLKAQRAAAVLDDEDMESAKSKRIREEDEALTFAPKPQEVESRVIATNRRVGRFQLEPKTKSLVWGVAAFAFSAGAISFLPSLLL